jgi:hypothetical protein
VGHTLETMDGQKLVKLEKKGRELLTFLKSFDEMVCPSLPKPCLDGVRSVLVRTVVEQPKRSLLQSTTVRGRQRYSLHSA